MSSFPTNLPPFLKDSFRDAIFYSLMVGMGESYLVAFLLLLGLGEMQSGLVTVIPVMIGAILQLFAAKGIKLFKSRRRWVVFCASMQGMSLIAIAQLPRWKLEPDMMSFVVFALTSVYWSSALAAGPCWNIWIAKIVPKEYRLQFFATRTRVAQLCVLIGLAATGLILEFFRDTANYLYYFSLVFTACGLFRLLSAFFIYKQDEKGTDTVSIDASRQSIFERGNQLLAEPRILKMVGYLFVFNLAVYISAPFFNPYMLKQINLEFLEYTALICASFLARVFANDIFVILAKKYGVKALLYAGAAGIAPLPFLWSYSDGFVYLIVLQLIAGFAWGSHELGVTLVLLEKHSERERSIILTMANMFNSTGMFVGGLIGGQILSANGVISMESYYMLFAIATVARFIPAAILFYMDHVPVPVRRVYLRVLGVRPGGGSIVKPMLYTDDDVNEGGK